MGKILPDWFGPRGQRAIGGNNTDPSETNKKNHSDLHFSKPRDI